MQKLLIATSNPGKAGEYRQVLSELPLKLVLLSDLGLSSIEETGATFEENARLKAASYFQKSGLPCIADDGGLEVDALSGEPGVKSRRWKTGDENVTDEELVAYTLERMKGIPDEKRGARLRLVMAFADREGEIFTAEASIEGRIAFTPSAFEPGFPYRGLLFIPRFGKMYDDLSVEEHELLNHRILALRKLEPLIRKKLCA